MEEITHLGINMDDMVSLGIIQNIFIVVGICVVLPIMIVWLLQRSKLKSEQNRKEIILAALEKNANINIEDLVKQMNKPDKLLKEKLLKKLQWGLTLTLIGIAMVVTGIIYLSVSNGDGDYEPLLIFGAITTLGGISPLNTYYVGKKMLEREMEAEEKKMQEN